MPCHDVYKYINKCFEFTSTAGTHSILLHGGHIPDDFEHGHVTTGFVYVETHISREPGLHVVKLSHHPVYSSHCIQGEHIPCICNETSQLTDMVQKWAITPAAKILPIKLKAIHSFTYLILTSGNMAKAENTPPLIFLM